MSPSDKPVHRLLPARPPTPKPLVPQASPVGLVPESAQTTETGPTLCQTGAPVLNAKRGHRPDETGATVLAPGGVVYGNSPHLQVPTAVLNPSISSRSRACLVSRA